MSGVHAVIDASNLKVGGGVQVASSFITEINRGGVESEFPWLRGTRILISPEVGANIPSEIVSDPRITINGAPRWGARPTLDLASNAVWFDVFGSTVQRRVPVKRLVGFADVTSIYRDPLASTGELLRSTVRGRVSLQNFRSADHLVVETEAVRDRLSRKGFSSEDISVVPNCYHPVFDAQTDESAVAKWRHRLESLSPDTLKILYVARAYKHKNHDYLGEVGAELTNTSTVASKFVVTLTEGEWAARTPRFREHAINVGAMSVHELPALYLAVDAVIFPSVLECFSATPLEALRSAKPLFASDRDFVRAIVGSCAIYFDPMNPEDGARVVRDFATSPRSRNGAVEEGLRLASDAPTSADRAMRYLDIMDRMRTRSSRSRI